MGTARRRGLVQQRTEVKNRLRALLRDAKITPPRTRRVWTKVGRAWLAELQWPTPGGSLQRDVLLRQVQSLDREVKKVDFELRHLVSHSAAISQLVRMTGLGVHTAERALAALEEWRRQQP